MQTWFDAQLDQKILDSIYYRCHVNSYNYAFYIWSHLLWKKAKKNQNLFISSISYSSFHRMYITWLEPSCMYLHCRFLVPDNTQKILTEIWHHFWLKNDDEKWSRKNYFKIPRWPSELLLPSAKKFAQKGWIGLAG